MKKKILFFLLFCCIGFSQENTIKGIIKDAETNEVIPFVNIIFKDSKDDFSSGSMSNENGEFSIDKTKIVEFSHLNYESQNVELKESLNEIYLMPKVYILDEIIMSNISGKDHLKSLIKDAKIRAVKNTKLSTYGREIVKINNQYTKFADAKIDYFIKKGNGKSVLQIKQSRAFKADLIDSTSSVLNSMDSAYDVRDYVKNAYNFDGIERLVKSNDYTFDRYLRRDESGFEYEYIKVIPNPDSDKLLYEGYVIVDSKTNKIIEFKVELAKSHKKNSKLKNIIIAKFKIIDHSVWCKLKYTNDQYELVYYKNSFDIYIQMGKKVHDNVSSTCDLFVYDYKNDVDIPKEGYKGKTIFEAGTNFTENFWNMNNIYPLKESEQQFINSVKN
ncbi:carboxypeptidase-like regulatory domain-containing protein [Flavobacterium jejuense]|uniref:Carboxypeptidase-like regulatory domain-containing protein n=1 Tax=Flavobacterium jejuense TaxID=1544455 RepID=A0ABX0IQJ2_9FLAO|nr:carboxypeptidase-like regulatory domain-containing protein [Flavobacterium jejuense]NHN26090.1 carboxypeptidase-like regulatory domain-containing protein [Flavobacterium jejuense]